jgi:DNA-3-methyladenine glycosylase
MKKINLDRFEMHLNPAYTCNWMLNVVTGETDAPSAVLIRGAEVLAGQAQVLERRRAVRPSASLCAGPGKVAQALGLDRSFDGHDLLAPEGLQLWEGPAPGRILAGPRVGIAFATPADQRRPWRFALAGSPAVSRPRVGG